MTFETWFKSKDPSINPTSQKAVLKLTEEGATVPFMARYRKEATGGLNEVQIQAVIDGWEQWNETLKRQAFILKEIESQGKLTDDLKKKISSAFDLDILEDLYLPYKKKRKTKATLAKEAGLEPLAQWLWDLGQGSVKDRTPLLEKATGFLNEAKEIKTPEQALKGAQDILVERIAENADLRAYARGKLFAQGRVKSRKGEKVKTPSKFDGYFDHEETITALMKPQSSHRYLAMRRGWQENELILSVEGPEEEIFNHILKHAMPVSGTQAQEILTQSVKLALKGFIWVSLETEVHRTLKDNADKAAISVFAENVKKLLLAAPFGAKTVVGIDPGIRTGCKLAIVDASGKYVASIVLNLQTDAQKSDAAQMLKELLTKVKIEAIAIGNGTAGRETESFVRGVVKEAGSSVPVVMVNEAGASVYSASEVAREEFPELDATIRGAISIARRLQDPLAELVKIDAKSIGVGQYQHDVNQSHLKKELDQVVVWCVNSVGIDLNTASKSLLSYVSGIGPATAQAVVDYRAKKGVLKNRRDLLEIPRFTQKAFEQAAGFLRVRGGENPLDNTGVHPERYSTIESAARAMGSTLKDLLGPEGVAKLKKSEELKKAVGEFTFNDIIDELEKPGRDPRESFVAFSFRDDIHQVEDLKDGMICPGIVTNVTNFGAFVDIGVHQDGLVHLSELADRFVKDAREVVSPGDHVTVRLLGVNKEKRQISLSMRKEAAPRGAVQHVPGAHGKPVSTGPNRPAARPSQNRGPRPGPGSRQSQRPPPRAAPARPLKEKPIDPNSPFAALAVLKGQLKR